MHKYHPQIFRLDLVMQLDNSISFGDVVTDAGMGPKFFHEWAHFLQHVLTAEGVYQTALFWRGQAAWRPILSGLAYLPGYKGGSVSSYCVRNFKSLPDLFLAPVNTVFATMREISYSFGFSAGDELVSHQSEGQTLRLCQYEVWPCNFELFPGQRVKAIGLSEKDRQDDILASWHLFESIAHIVESVEARGGTETLSFLDGRVFETDDMTDEWLALRLFSELSGSRNILLFLVLAEAALQTSAPLLESPIEQPKCNSGTRFWELCQQARAYPLDYGTDTLEKACQVYAKALNYLGYDATAVDRTFSDRVRELLRHLCPPQHPLEEYIVQLAGLRSLLAGKPLFVGQVAMAEYVVRLMKEVAERGLGPLITFLNGCISGGTNSKYYEQLLRYAVTREFSSGLWTSGEAGCNVYRQYPGQCHGDCVKGFRELSCVLAEQHRSQLRGVSLRLSSPEPRNCWSPIIMVYVSRRATAVVNGISELATRLSAAGVLQLDTTASNLLTTLRSEGSLTTADFPRSPQALGKLMNNLSANFGELGINFTRMPRRGGVKPWRLSWQDRHARA